MRGRREQRPHIHRIHAGGANGGHAKFGVLVGPALLRRHAETLGGFEENVGRRLLVHHVFARDDRGKEVADAEVFKHALDNATRAAGRHGHRNLAMIRAGDVDDGVDGLDVQKARQIGFLLFVRDGDVVERTALFLRQQLEDVARRNPAQ